MAKKQKKLTLYAVAAAFTAECCTTPHVLLDFIEAATPKQAVAKMQRTAAKLPIELGEVRSYEVPRP